MVIQQTIERSVNAIVDIIHIVRNGARRILIRTYRTFAMNARC